MSVHARTDSTELEAERAFLRRHDEDRQTEWLRAAEQTACFHSQDSAAQSRGDFQNALIHRRYRGIPLRNVTA